MDDKNAFKILAFVLVMAWNLLAILAVVFALINVLDVSELILIMTGLTAIIVASFGLLKKAVVQK